MASRLDRGGAPSWRGADLLYVLTKLGQRPDLQLALDAGDAASYDGSSQSWLDRSGNGYDFFRGTTSGATAADPTFNGTAGLVSSGEYFSFDGGDLFQYDSANETWMNNIHKNNAKYTLAAWIWNNSVGVDNQMIFATGSTAVSTAGFIFFLLASGHVALRVTNGSALTLDLVGGVGPLTTVNQWTFMACSVDEAAGTAILHANGVTTSHSGTYTSPSASNAGGTLRLGANNAATDPILSGGRMAMAMAWEARALTAGELAAIYMATRGRFGV